MMGHYYSEVADQYENMKYRGKDADQPAGEKKEMTAKELALEVEEKISTYLKRNGWTFVILNGEGGSRLWMKVFTHANNGIVYDNPILKTVSDINMALAIQRSREEKAAEWEGVKV